MTISLKRPSGSARMKSRLSAQASCGRSSGRGRSRGHSAGCAGSVRCTCTRPVYCRHRIHRIHCRAGRLRQDPGADPPGGGPVSARPVRADAGADADGAPRRPVPPAAAGGVRRSARPAGGDAARRGPHARYGAPGSLSRRRARAARQRHPPADRRRRRRALRAARRDRGGADAVGGGRRAAGRGRARRAFGGGRSANRRPAARGAGGDLRRLSRRAAVLPPAPAGGAAGHRGRSRRRRARSPRLGDRRRLHVLQRRRVAAAGRARQRPQPAAIVRSGRRRARRPLIRATAAAVPGSGDRAGRSGRGPPERARLRSRRPRSATPRHGARHQAAVDRRPQPAAVRLRGDVPNARPGAGLGAPSVRRIRPAARSRGRRAAGQPSARRLATAAAAPARRGVAAARPDRRARQRVHQPRALAARRGDGRPHRPARTEAALVGRPRRLGPVGGSAPATGSGGGTGAARHGGARPGRGAFRSVRPSGTCACACRRARPPGEGGAVRPAAAHPSRGRRRDRPCRRDRRGSRPP